MNIKEPTGRLARWSLEIQQYDFEVIHRARRLNGNADALSCYSYESLAIAAMSSTSYRAEEIREFQNRDPQIAAMTDYLTLGFLPPDEAEARSILLESDQYYLNKDSILYHIWTPPRHTIAVSCSYIFTTKHLISNA